MALGRNKRKWIQWGKGSKKEQEIGQGTEDD